MEGRVDVRQENVQSREDLDDIDRELASVTTLLLLSRLQTIVSML